MKLAISNIGWTPDLARDAYALMARHGFTGLEIAPGLTFPGEADVFHPSAPALAAFRANLAEFGLTPVSMQSLLFGVSGAQIFGTAEELANFERAMDRAIGLAETLGIPNLVFGSPKNRAYPDGMTPQQVEAHSGAVFRRLGDRALAAGTRIALEPNPADYGTNFLTTVEEAARYVAALDHPGITLNFDLGAQAMNGEQDRAAALYELAGGRVSHVHISEPHLAPAPADPARLATIASDLLARGYQHWFSIEMRAPDSGVLEQLAASLASVAGVMNGAGARNHA